MSDGKIIAAGTTQASGFQSVFVARISSSGNLDGMFGSGGMRIINIGIPVDTEPKGVAVTSDGRIVVGIYAGRIARLTASGTLDSSFGSGGILVTGLPVTRRIALDSADRIVVLGDSSIARFGADGSAEPAFSTSIPNATLISIQADGRFVLSTSSGITRLNDTTPPTVDSGFGTGGYTTTPFNVQALALRSDGSIVVAGMHTQPSYNEAAMMRLDQDGTLDSSFGSDGLTYFRFGSAPTSVIRALSINAAQQILATGDHEVAGDSEIAAVRVFGDDPPASLTSPSLIGNSAGVVGEAIQCDPGIWDTTPTASLSYEWLRNGVTVVGAGTTYTPTALDHGSNVSCEVTATSTAGANYELSESRYILPLSNIGPPEISGNPAGAVGIPIECTSGTWNSPSPTFTFSWRRSGVAISGAQNESYTPTDADRDSLISCEVVASAGPYTASATSTSRLIQPATDGSGGTGTTEETSDPDDGDPDETGPPFEVTMNAPRLRVVFPYVRDGYRDYVQVKYRSNYAAEFRADVFDARGRRIGSYQAPDYDPEFGSVNPDFPLVIDEDWGTWRWNGRLRNGRPAPVGRYRIRITGTTNGLHQSRSLTVFVRRGTRVVRRTLTKSGMQYSSLSASRCGTAPYDGSSLQIDCLRGSATAGYRFTIPRNATRVRGTIVGNNVGCCLTPGVVRASVSRRGRSATVYLHVTGLRQFVSETAKISYTARVAA